MIVKPITILLPVHKATKFIDFKKSINSITFNQTFVPKEIIILVDGTVDLRIFSYVNYLRVSFKFSKFLIFKFNINQGLGVVLNRGILLAKFDLILRCDSDDFSSKDRVKILCDIYLKNKNISVIDSAMLEILNGKSYIRYFDTIKKNNINFLKFRNPINHPSVLMKKKDVIKSGNYKKMPFFEDYYLWTRMIKHEFKFTGTRKILVKTLVDKNFYARRSGKKYLNNYKNFLLACLKIKYINILELNILYFLRYFIIVSNKYFLVFFYKTFLRKRI
jgi:glycosyltransferase involved in cell wall biosynthesis